MPILIRSFLKAALVYLILAVCCGLALALPIRSPLTSLFPVYIHTLVFGWLTQLIFGVATWMFPKYSAAEPRGREWLSWTAFVCLNVGLGLRVVFEPLHSITPSAWSAWGLLISAVLQWAAGVAFVANMWPRVKVR
ncbi:MAG: hypothetical protein LC099_05900 [Anaerolineales bacterium]|nr:hypothetical protein [Anaerolineales bacterium]